MRWWWPTVWILMLHCCQVVKTFNLNNGLVIDMLFFLALPITSYSVWLAWKQKHRQFDKHHVRHLRTFLFEMAARISSILRIGGNWLNFTLFWKLLRDFLGKVSMSWQPLFAPLPIRRKSVSRVAVLSGWQFMTILVQHCWTRLFF